MTLYEEAYEKFLAVALAEWAEAHKDDAIKAFRDFFGKSEEAIESGVSYYGWQGPVSYQIRWKGEAMAKAEVFTGAALFLLRELDAERTEEDNVLPSDILKQLEKELHRAVKSSVTAGSSGFAFEVERAVGKAAMELLEDSFEFRGAIYTATMRAENEVIAEDVTAGLNKANSVLRELKSKKASMRSETRIAKINVEIEEAERQVELYRSAREHDLVLAKTTESLTV